LRVSDLRLFYQTRPYRLNLDTRVAAHGFVECKGIVFSGDGKIAYVSVLPHNSTNCVFSTDTGLESDAGLDQTKPAAMYVFSESFIFHG
jgi:hypothetical protein